MFKVGDDVFVFDTCSFASTITSIQNGKIWVQCNTTMCCYDIDSWKIEPYTDERFASVLWAQDYRRGKEIFKIGDEVVLLHITGSGYCKVLEIDEDKVKVDWASEHFPPQWYPKKLLRYATDADRDFVNAFKNLKLNREEK